MGLITISVRFLSVVRALRAFLERLLRIGVGLQVMMSFSIALMKASRAASLPLGGVHVPLYLKRFTSSDGLVESVLLFWWKNTSRRKR